jgi:RimJ/RimL family protein N-acetyltransferase
MADPFVPPGFDPPRELLTSHTVLRPLGPEHNEPDYAAWTSSVDHIRATPGYTADSTWPDSAMTLEQNLADLQMHARHFAERAGFTYTVLDRADESRVVGCVYIYPHDDPEQDAHVRSWVTADRAELDVEVWQAVAAWIDRDWPFGTVEYATRAT